MTIETYTEAQDEGFAITDDVLADWAVRTLQAEEAEHARLMAIADAQYKELRERAEAMQAKHERQKAHLTALLHDYFMTVPPSKTTKTQVQYQLLSGKLVLKKQAPEYRRDEAVIVDWAKANAPGYVQVKESIAWGELKKATQTKGEQVILKETGEVLPGIVAKAREDVFEVVL